MQNKDRILLSQKATVNNFTKQKNSNEKLFSQMN